MKTTDLTMNTDLKIFNKYFLTKCWYIMRIIYYNQMEFVIQYKIMSSLKNNV